VLSFVLGVHRALVPIILVIGGLALVAGIACIVLSRRAGGAEAAGPQSAVGRGFRLLLWAAAGLGVLQGQHPAEGLHFVYGIIVAGAVPVAYVYSDQKDVRRDVIVMTIAAAAVIGAAIRAIATG
jgi:hypothetical protein